MYLHTIAALKKRNEDISHKLPTLNESIKTYESLAQNSTIERYTLIEEKWQNERVIKMLERSKNEGLSDMGSGETGEEV